MNDHSPDCDTNDINAEGIEKPCNCHGRITEAALLIANVAEAQEVPPIWINHPRWTVFVNRTANSSHVSRDDGNIVSKATVPFGSVAVWDGNRVVGVFSANEGYLNNADEFINDMKELLEKEAV